MADGSTMIGLPDNYQPDGQRLMIALRASWESEACAAAALDELADAYAGDERIYTLRALLLRLHSMSRVASGALSNGREDVRSMLKIIEGRVHHE